MADGNVIQGVGASVAQLWTFQTFTQGVVVGKIRKNPYYVVHYFEGPIVRRERYQSRCEYNYYIFIKLYQSL